MGKSEEEQPLPVGVSSSELSDRNVENRCGGGGCSEIRKLIAVRCVFFLLLSAAVFLSAIFWLPPFLSYGNWPDRPIDSAYRGWNLPHFLWFHGFLVLVSRVLSACTLGFCWWVSVFVIRLPFSCCCDF